MDYILKFNNGKVTGRFKKIDHIQATILKDIRQDYDVSVDEACDILGITPFLYYSMEYGDPDIPLGFYILCSIKMIDYLDDFDDLEYV